MALPPALSSPPKLLYSWPETLEPEAFHFADVPPDREPRPPRLPSLDKLAAWPGAPIVGLKVAGPTPPDVLLDAAPPRKAAAAPLDPGPALQQLQQHLERHDLELEALREQLLTLSQVQATKSEVHRWQTEARKSIVIRDDDEAFAVPYYHFTASMWDAVLLLFFRGMSFAERLVLVLGFMLNLGLQTTLVAVVKYDLLDNPFEGMVDKMMHWRVDVGHAEWTMDKTYGRSLVEQLCAGEKWSFEQQQYEEMKDYLYQPVPGYVLSLLAIVIWVLASMVEYRRITEQALALFTLPHSGVFGIRTIVSGESKEFEIVGVECTHCFAALFFVCLPRLLVVALLCYYGCQFLAQTPNLPDIMLNCMALSFVLDVDDILCQVLVPHRLRNILDRMRPLPVGNQKSFSNQKLWGFVYRDITRMWLTGAIVAASAFLYLRPFHDSIHGASLALCGGHRRFTFEGGTSAAPTVVLKNTSGWRPACKEDMMARHLGEFYGVSYNSSAHNMNYTVSDTAFELRRLEAVFRFAFEGCEPLKVKSPLNNCIQLPDSLRAVLPEGVVPGWGFKPRTCAFLQPSLRENACKAMNETIRTQDVCRWDWQHQVCEGDEAPPGNVGRQACSANLWESCPMWNSFLKSSHPTANCRITKVCAEGDVTCFSMFGELLLRPAGLAWPEEAPGAVRLALSRLGALPVEKVDVSFSNSSAGAREAVFLLSGMGAGAGPEAISPEAVVAAVNFALNRTLLLQASLKDVSFGRREAMRKLYYGRTDHDDRRLAALGAAGRGPAE